MYVYPIIGVGRGGIAVLWNNNIKFFLYSDS